MSEFFIKDDTFLLTSIKDNANNSEKQRLRLKKRNENIRNSSYAYSKFSSKIILKFKFNKN
jgi:hypothetical protein